MGRSVPPPHVREFGPQSKAAARQVGALARPGAVKDGGVYTLAGYAGRAGGTAAALGAVPRTGGESDSSDDELSESEDCLQAAALGTGRVRG